MCSGRPRGASTAFPHRASGVHLPGDVRPRQIVTWVLQDKHEGKSLPSLQNAGQESSARSRPRRFAGLFVQRATDHNIDLQHALRYLPSQNSSANDGPHRFCKPSRPGRAHHLAQGPPLLQPRHHVPQRACTKHASAGISAQHGGATKEAYRVRFTPLRTLSDRQIDDPTKECILAIVKPTRFHQSHGLHMFAPAH